MDLIFEKYQGCGNDFIIIDNLNNQIDLSKEKINFLCDRHFGIGADGLILLEKKKYYHMNYFNSDGNSAEICGNGLRCLFRYLIDHNLIHQDSKVSSEAGISNVNIKDRAIEVEMPKTSIKDQGSFIYKNDVINYGIVDIGNPHLILLGPKLENFSIEYLGPLLEKDILFKDGINVNFVEIVDKNHILLKTWERDDGLTLACGSGASASVYFLQSLGLLNSKVKVKVPGGELLISSKEDKIYLQGPALRVFKGEIEI